MLTGLNLGIGAVNKSVGQLGLSGGVVDRVG